MPPRWLAEITTDEDLLLAEFPMCNFLPRYGKGRVFNGHFDLTVDMEGKSELVETFWQQKLPTNGGRISLTIGGSHTSTRAATKMRITKATLLSCLTKSSTRQK